MSVSSAPCSLSLPCWKGRTHRVLRKSSFREISSSSPNINAAAPPTSAAWSTVYGKTFYTREFDTFYVYSNTAHRL